MNKSLLWAICVGLAAGTGARGAEKSASPSMADHSHIKAEAKADVSAIDNYVRGVEKKVSGFTRKEAKLTAGELKKVTDETWTKIHTYWEGTTLKRMKMYPGPGSTKTEEFYYQDGNPVFVFLEENGAGKENHDSKAVGEKFYFAHGKLVAAYTSDGKAMDIKNSGVKKQAQKLKKESDAFRATTK